MITLMDKVIEEVKADDLGKRDFHVKAQDITFTPNGTFNFVSAENELFTGQHMNEHALTQLSNRIGIPSRYAKKCMEVQPELFSDHANHWINEPEMRDKNWFVRAKADVARAFLTDRYSTLDNGYVVETLQQVLGKGGHVDVKNFNLDPKFFNLRMVFSDMNMNVGTLQNPDNVMVGIHITNSEVGSSSLRIDSCIYRLVCSNGMIARVGGQPLLAQRHANLTDGEMQNRVSSSIVEAVRIGDETIGNFAKLQDVKINDPFEEIKRLAKQEKYSDKFVDDLQNSYATEKAITNNDSAFTIVNALTRSAQNMPSFERRLEIETFAGKVMNGYLK